MTCIFIRDVMALYNMKRIKHGVGTLTQSYCIKSIHEREYKKCYQVLGIPENSDQECVRKAYVELVKRFHPDSHTDEADANKFQEIDGAFRMLTNKLSRERWNVGSAEEFDDQDIMHTAPQHRQYLSYSGMGHGNPFQREKQYMKIRAAQATEHVLQHRLAKVAADDKSVMAKVSYNHKIKTKYGMDRLVEDLIQEAVSKGQFNNLSGSGKPLQNTSDKNPYVDFVTHKLNEILIENGFTPEWIALQKEIRNDSQALRDKLCVERVNFSPYPLSIEEHNRWSEAIDKHKEAVNKLNEKINKYNLLVPILQRQMLFVNFDKEAEKVLVNGKSQNDLVNVATRQHNEINKESSLMLKFIQLFFKN